MDLADLLNEAFPDFHFIPSRNSKNIINIMKCAPPSSHMTAEARSSRFKVEPWLLLIKNGWIYGPSRIVRLIKPEIEHHKVGKIVHITDPDFLKRIDLLLMKIIQSESDVIDDNSNDNRSAQ